MAGLSSVGEDPSCEALEMVLVALGEVPYVEGPCVDPCVTLGEFPYADQAEVPYADQGEVPYADQGEVPYDVLGVVPYMAPLYVNLMTLGVAPCAALVAPYVHQEEVPCVAP